jgi:nitrogen regulatory protein P-II 2
MKLVTVIAEPSVEHRLTAELLALGATGFTVVDGRGEGSRHLGGAEFPGSVVRVETLVPPAVADAILARLAEHWFADHSIVTYVSDVAVVRTRKYDTGRPPARLPHWGARDGVR